MNLEDLALTLVEHKGQEGATFECQPIPGNHDVFQVTVNDMEEVPVYVSVTDRQVLCISYLWTEKDIDPKKKSEMMESMLEMNIPIPLSSFAKVGDRYALFGALSINSSFEDIAHEVVTLSENAVEAFTAMEGFLATD